MKKLTLTALALIALTACANGETTTAQSAQATKTETPTQSAPQAPQVAEVKKADGIWIDVRSPEEFAEGHLTDAINITHTDIASKIASVTTDKNAPINLYCRSGRRAETALQELKKLGYTNVTNHGGYDDLIKQGLK